MGQKLLHDQVISESEEYLASTYSQRPIVFSHGDGTYFTDALGKTYLDLTSGLGIVPLGHKHPAIVETAKSQIDSGIHSSNFYYNEPQAKLAKKLVELSGLSSVFLCSSGSESVDTAIKFARKWGNEQGDGKNRIISFNEAWHGRTLGTISATNDDSCRSNGAFEPLLPGFDLVPMFDIEAIKNAITEQTCAIMFEPVLGHGGILPAPEGFLEEIRSICDEHNLLMILDEIQTGLGRTGKFFAYQHTNISPDIVTLAKGLGNGHPIGATIVSERVANIITPGCHGAAFGGNPLSCAVALEVVQIISDEKFLENNIKLSELFSQELDAALKGSGSVEDIRVFGLMIGISFSNPSRPIGDKLLENGLAIITSYGTLARLLPSYITTEDDVSKAVDIFSSVLN